MTSTGPTHYEVLGVGPSATADEIKQAYRARARELHPDRGRNSVAPMARLNEAYRVLRDVSSRAAYDRVLRGEPAAAAPSAPAWKPGPPPLVRLREPKQRLSHPAAPWIVLGALVVMAVLFVVFAAANRNRDGGRGPAVDGVVGPGSCVITAPGRSEVAEVSCSEPHDGTAVAVVGFDETCPAGTEFFVNPAATRRVCVQLG